MKALIIEKTESELHIVLSSERLAKIQKEDFTFIAIDYDCKVSFINGNVVFRGGNIEKAYWASLDVIDELPTTHEQIKKERVKAYNEYRAGLQLTYNLKEKASL